MKPATFALSCALLAIPAAFQRRAKEPEPADFDHSVKAAQQAFTDKRYASCVKELQTALEVARGELRKTVLACLPDAPAGFTIKDADNRQGDAAAAALGVSVLAGGLVERTYQGSGGQRVQIKAQLGSPLVKSMLALFGNPAFRKPGTEVIEYEGAKATLERAPNMETLRVIVDEKHLFEVVGNKVGGDELLQFLPQASVDKLRAALKE